MQRTAVYLMFTRVLQKFTFSYKPSFPRHLHCRYFAPNPAASLSLLPFIVLTPAFDFYTTVCKFREHGKTHVSFALMDTYANHAGQPVM